VLFAQSGNRSRRLPAVDPLDDHIEPFRGGPDDFVFTSPERCFLRAYQFRRRLFRPAAVASRLAPFRSHDLRQSAISLWIASGGNPMVMRMKARHSSIEVTHDGYDHLFPVGDRYGARSDVPSASREQRPGKIVDTSIPRR